MAFRRFLNIFLILIATNLIAFGQTNFTSRLRPLYENRQIKKALALVGTNTPAEFYLRASFYSELGKRETAFSNYMRATNDQILRDHAFYHAGLCFRANSNTNGLRYLRRAEKANNIVLKYYASLAIGDLYAKRNIHDRAYASYSRAYDSLLKMEGPYYRLTDVLGNYYKSKNEFLIGRELHEMKRPESASWLLRVLRTGGDGRNNPYVVKAILLLTNYPLTSYDDTALMANQMLNSKIKNKKTREYVESALQKANSGQTLFAALEMMLEFDIHHDKTLAEKQLKIYGLYFQNSNWQDGILFYRGLLANIDKHTQTAWSNYTQVLGNSWHMHEYEERALLNMAIMKKDKNPKTIRTLLIQSKSMISNSQPLTDFFFKYAIEKFRPAKDFTNALFFYTNLPPLPANLYLRADAYTALKNHSSAIDCYQQIIRDNFSDFYTARSLKELKKLIISDKTTMTRFSNIAAEMKQHIDIRNDAPSLLNMKYLKLLSYEPDYVISANLFNSILRTNLHIGSIRIKTNLTIPF